VGRLWISMASAPIAQRIVGQIQHMVGFVVGKVNLEQVQPLINGIGQTQTAHSLAMHQDMIARWI